MALTPEQIANLKVGDTVWDTYSGSDNSPHIVPNEWRIRSIEYGVARMVVSHMYDRPEKSDFEVDDEVFLHKKDAEDHLRFKVAMTKLGGK